MTTPNGRDARTGEELEPTDPSISEQSGAGAAQQAQPPRTPDRDHRSATEQPTHSPKHAADDDPSA